MLADQASPKVVVTNGPLHALVYGVMQGVAKPVLLSSKNASHHGRDLRPSQLKRLSAADLLITMGKHIDTTVYKFAIANDIEIFSPGPDNTELLLEPRPLGVWDENHSIVKTETAFDEHGVDIHIWLSPANAVSLTSALVEKLSQVDPANADQYVANAQTQIKNIKAVDESLRVLLEASKNKPFVSYHDATQYLEYHYGLRSIASISVDDSHGTGARTVRDVRQAIADKNVRCLFREPGSEPKMIKSITENLNVKVVQYDPAGVLVTPGTEAWATTIRNVAEKLNGCLSDPG